MDALEVITFRNDRNPGLLRADCNLNGKVSAPPPRSAIHAAEHGVPVLGARMTEHATPCN
ncbi:hypothetical protein MNBD_PLANCTO03-2289 [hydrothermal vent metagenome]|uniref:Uncharacterized protein n=1 Tax=hydrothermal vent metagenome TaxID=652676 RepID=A0A3B1DRL8_9ZZZZ